MAQPSTLRFWTGDEQGRLKALTCSQKEGTWGVTVRTVPTVGSSKGVQKMSLLRQEDGEDLLAVARAEGGISLLHPSYVAEDGEPSATSLQETKEDRLRPGSHFVGLSVRDSGVYSCTSSGHLRLTPLPSSPSGSSETALGALPTRLRAMRLSPSGKTLAYGGDEVSASVWSVERAFAGKAEPAAEGNGNGEGGGRKRKNRELFPGEIWRARNEPNDTLDLRVPVHITALAYLSEDTLLTGNDDGSLRMYDTRAGRRPAGHWRGTFGAAVRAVEPGMAEHQVFAGDAAGTLGSIDTRTGRCMYTYRGLTSALTALAPAPQLLASVGRDRTFRLCSAPGPQEDARANQNLRGRGEVLVREWMPSVPGALVFAGFGEGAEGVKEGGEGEEGEGAEEEEEVWEGMEEIGSDDEPGRRRKRPRT
ncbi:hypothetical protein CALVIDRAFT_555881 [Calocera viscosa TUFC12733]|uniref:Ribosome biogenesis protein NSA1 n=1 Tax=Calocera viscosa (strain TUFC12733) TaxID=1330018 RepID=A0A167KZZ6_CALVF|nr:hypothetical protein CALVIDRAFT_555881 [Calocera viscosa TUFC12733]